MALDTIDRMLGVEGTGQNPRSSAVGPGQFINSTWLATIRKYRPDLAQGKSDKDILALRTNPPASDPNLGKEMTADYAKDNSQFLSSKGLPVNSGTTYLAHFLGPQGAASVLSADPNTPVSGIIGRQAVAANPFLQNMTAGQLIQWAGGKMGAEAQTLNAPQQPAPQQPMTPMQSPQGAPQFPTHAMGTAPNSGVVGASPFANQGVTGGDGFPIGGLPSQQPMPRLSGPNPIHIQRMQQYLAGLPAIIRPYIFGQG